MTYNDMVYAYGIDNVKQLGSRVIVIDRQYQQAIGYDIKTYNGFAPNELANKVYTEISNTGYTWDGAYDYLYGKPQAPNFTKTLAV